MVAVMAGWVGFFSILLIGKLAQRYPRLTVVGMVGHLAGRWTGKAVGLCLGVLFGLNAGVDLRMALKAVEGTYFINTPTVVISLLMAGVAMSITWFGIVHASRLGPLFLGTLVLAFVLTFPLLWKWMQPGYLVPLLDLSDLEVRSRGFWSAMAAFRGGLMLVALFPYIAKPQKALRVYGWAHWFGWLGVFFAVLTPVMVFSPAGARSLVQPFPYILAVIRLPNFPLERVEMLARLVYNLSVLYAVASMYFVGAVLLAESFGTRSIRPFLLVVEGVSLLLVVTIPAQISAEAVDGWILLTSLVLTWTLFPLLWVIHLLRRRRQQAASM